MVSKLNADEVLHFLIIVTSLLIVARVFGEICRRFKQPVVIGEILAGIVLGLFTAGGAISRSFQSNIYIAGEILRRF